MKKIVLLIFLINIGFCFAQNVSSAAASRKTAERCLKLAESYLLAGDYKSSLSQAEMGLSYDDSISDLYYVKAASLKMSGASKKELISISKTAIDRANWVGYNEKGNRILYADLLSDTGLLKEALRVIDATPFIFSSDAEAIRIKTYYRMGTDESIDKARSKVNSARRIYKGDLRFYQLFYTFECARCLRFGKDYPIEGEVLEIADVLRTELKSIGKIPSELECLSIFFAEGEEQTRALKSFDARDLESPLFPIIALKVGFWDEDKAFEEFFKFADKSIPSEMLAYFASLLKSDEIKSRFHLTLLAYDGTLYADLDSDAQAELEIVYERGRPQYIHFDYNNDGEEDLYGVMDFGELLAVYLTPLRTEINYSTYPFVSQVIVRVEDEEYSGDVVFDFSKKAAAMSPIEFTRPEIFQIGMSSDADEGETFFVPFVKEFSNPQIMDFLEKATFVKCSSGERKNSSVVYSVLEGKVVSALFTDNGVVYANAIFENGLPVSREVDYNYDNVYETTEFFTTFEETFGAEPFGDKFSIEDKNQLKRLFGIFDFSNDVYLSKIQIDRDEDSVPDFQETYSEYGGRVVSWDNNSDGIFENVYIRYPQKEGEPLVEDAVFVVGMAGDKITVETIDSEPTEVRMNEEKYRVFPGQMQNFYWIAEECPAEDELFILPRMENMEQGYVITLESEINRYNCIKVSQNIFAKRIPFTTVDMEIINEILADETEKTGEVEFENAQ